MRVDLIKALSLAGRGGSITNRCGAGAGPAYDPRRGLIHMYKTIRLKLDCCVCVCAFVCLSGYNINRKHHMYIY